MTLKLNATPYKQKTEIFLVTRPPTGLKFDSCFWFLRNDKKRDKSKFVAVFVRIRLQLQLFPCKNMSKTASKTFAT